MKTKVVAYIRVSTEQQAESGLSLDAQRSKVKHYANALDLDLVDIIEDPGVSATTLDRPGLQKALSMLNDGLATGLLVTKLDRLTRKVHHLGVLLENYFMDQYALLSVGDNIDTRSASGVLMLNLLMSVAQWERDVISERTKTAMIQVRGRRGFLGRVPFGQHVTKRADGIYVHETNQEQQSAIALILARRQAGWGLERIAAELNQRKVPSPGGASWYATTVKRVVERHAKAA